jgi:hypothetical protein
VAKIREIADNYMKSAGIPYDPPKKFLPVDKDRATRVADAFTEMKHDPDDPKVKKAYAAMAKETIAQWQAIKDSGLEIEWIKDAQSDPYAATPRSRSDGCSTEQSLVGVFNRYRVWHSR